MEVTQLLYAHEVKTFIYNTHNVLFFITKPTIDKIQVAFRF